MPAFDDELLSAYLDGELSAAESARVERLLAEQPESRQLLEELRSIKAGLERVPRARLPHDFADQVLRQAEREVLTAPGGGEAGGGASGNGNMTRETVEKIDDAERLERARGFSWQRMRRPVLWASLTLAAGLLIMFLDRDRLQPAAKRQVAMAPGGAPLRDDGEIAAPADEAEPVRPLVRDEPRSEVEMSVPGRPARALPASEPASATSSSKKNSLAARGGMAGGLDDRTAGAKAPALRATDETANGPSFGASQKAMPAKDARKAELVSQLEQRRSPIAADQALVVWCDVSPNTQYNERFRQLLTSNSIEWNDEEDLAEKETMDDRLAADKEKQATGERKKAPTPGKPLKEQSAPNQVQGPSSRSVPASREAEPEQLGLLLQRRANRQNKSRLAAAQEAVLDPNAELVVVEASEPQIEAVLAELDRDGDVFKTVDVEPATNAPRQQSFERYRRGVVELNESGKAGDSQQRNGLSKKRGETPPPPAPANAAGASQSNQISQGFAYRLNSRSAQRTNTAQDRKLDETKRPTEPDEDRLQVLFVLHPLEDEKPAATAPPADASKPKDD